MTSEQRARQIIEAAYQGDDAGVLRLAMGRAPRQRAVSLIGCWVEAERKYVAMIEYTSITDEWRHMPVKALTNMWLTAVQWEPVERSISEIKS